MNGQDKPAEKQTKAKIKKVLSNKITANMVKDFVIATKTQIDLSNWYLVHWNPQTRKLQFACKTDSTPEREGLEAALKFFKLTIDDVHETFWDGSWNYRLIF